MRPICTLCLLLFTLILHAQSKKINYQLSIGIGLVNAPNKWNTGLYFYHINRTLGYHLGGEVHYNPIKPLAIFGGLGLYRMGFHGKHYRQILQLPENFPYRDVQEFWSDVRFYNLGIKCGIEGNLKKRFALGGGLLLLHNVHTSETIQEVRISELVTPDRNQFFKKEKTTTDRFKKDDIGFTIYLKHYINQYCGFSFNYFFSKNPITHSWEDTNYQQNTFLILKLFYNL